MKIWVIPGGPDRRVPLPAGNGQYFPADRPSEVDDTDQYIQRRLADGDLVRGEAQSDRHEETH